MAQSSTQAKSRSDVIVLGAGAAGLMCAGAAGQRGKNVLLLDHADQVGKKILISGGGRCNFTNIDCAADRFLSSNPHYAKSALGRYTADNFLDLVNAHGISWHEKTLGQLFCDSSARQIVDMLLEECSKGGVTVKVGHRIRSVTHSDGIFTVATNQGDYEAQSLVIATGGPSIPKMGATGFAYELARKFGLNVITPRPALVPFTLSAEQRIFNTLTGLSADAVARCGKASFREAFLFTHKGLSGPAILQVSSYWSPGDSITINMLPDHKPNWLCELKRAKPRATLQSILSTELPSRLAQLLADHLSDEIGQEGELANIPDRSLSHVEHKLSAWQFTPDGTEGFAKAEVTAGGIDTSELSSKTMETKKVPGLYVIGEAVDVTGWLGGYNFQWAWASGHAAAQSL